MQLIKYSAISAPVIILANAFLFQGFQLGTKMANLASVVAFQTGIYLFMLSILGYFVFKDDLSLNVFMGLIVVSIGAYIINT